MTDAGTLHNFVSAGVLRTTRRRVRYCILVGRAVF
jgi:hypothetical protein